MPLNGRILEDSDDEDAYEVEFFHGGEEHVVACLRSYEDAETVLDALTIAAYALEEAAARGGGEPAAHLKLDLSGLQLRSPLATQSIHFSSEALSKLQQLGIAGLADKLWYVAIECRSDAESFSLQHSAAYCSSGIVLLMLLAARPGTACGVDELGNTPLHMAAQNGDADAVRLLLANAPTTAAQPDKRGNLPLHLAAEYGNTAAVRLLLEAAPATAELENAYGCAPLHCAACSNSIDAVRLLLQAAPAIAALQDALGFAPLHWAARRGCTEAVRLLLQAAPATARLRCGEHDLDLPEEQPLFLAAAGGHLEACRLLLAAAPEVAAAADCLGYTPLHWAVQGGGSGELVQLLLAAAPQAALQRDRVEDYETTPLQHAVIHNIAAARVLLAAAPQAARIADAYGKLPIHTAAKSGNIEMIQLLAAADPSSAAALAPGGNTPLHIAAAEGRSEAVRQLLQLAPNTVFVANENQVTPLHAASLNGHAAAAEVLLAAAPQAAMALDHYGRTPAHLAAMRGRTEVLKALLRAAPDTAAAATAGPEHPHKAGSYTPAHMAAMKGQAAALEVLLAAAPGTAAVKDDDGFLPLDHALYALYVDDAPWEQRLAAARVLVGRGPAITEIAALKEAGREAAPLFADFVMARLPLSDALWAEIGQTCPGLGRALPAALAHSPQQAAAVVRRLPAADRQRLRAAALCLARAQRRLRIFLPLSIEQQILASAFE